ncbi:uracil phosphoribosyltransferase homolog isoform X1 [Podarcis raffonei]|uniref:uracil phosphoribosyltransferase homolog isoform X1 n=1 Tax=Podarcis raffonei TaxID=65483 RepID=UPI0023290ECC|nr:uracil phosphoribosyltransferase homolog isoform X1 [Podarcis raffonei]
METMPCHNQRVGSADAPRQQQQQAGATDRDQDCSEQAVTGSGVGSGVVSRQLRFSEPGPGGDSPSPDSSSCCSGSGGGGCSCSGSNGGGPDTAPSPTLDLPAAAAPRLKLLPMNDQIRELQTIIRDRTSSRGDFVFSADRLIRLVVEEGLNQLPYTECTVTTPTGYKYEGVKFEKGNCGVSIMRSGEAMEQGLRDCCRSIRIGKILIQSDEDTQRAKVYYAKFPPDIFRRKVLLMYPILSTGNTVIEAVKVLIEHGVQPNVIILLSLFSTPHGAKSIIQEFPDITILTTEVHPVAPTHFGQKYFGTD